MEPLNTISNIAIFIAAIYAFLAIRRGKYPLDALLLTGFLLATAIGSTLWHSLRTPWALSFDVLPGLLFFLTFVYFWIRRLYGIPIGGVALLATLGASLGAGYVGGLIGFRGFQSSFVGIAIVGLIFILATWRTAGGGAAQLGALALALAAAAALARSLDLWFCNYVPFGTHFLWHFLLAGAAYTGIRLLLHLENR